MILSKKNNIMLVIGILTILMVLIFMVSVTNGVLGTTGNENERIDFNINLDKTSDNKIRIIDAEHLDENKDFISNIYDKVYQLDNIWKTIREEEYVRVTFEKNLTNENDITIFLRIIDGDPRIEVYEVNGKEIIAEFADLISNSYNKIFLTNLISESQNVFDLRVVGGIV